MIKGLIFTWGIRFCFSIFPAVIALALLFAIFTENAKTKLILSASQNDQLSLTPVSETTTLYFAYIYAKSPTSDEILPVLVPSSDRKKLLTQEITVLPTYNNETPYVLASMVEEHSEAWTVAGVFFTPFSMILLFWALLLGLWSIAFEYNVRTDDDEFLQSDWTDDPKMRLLVQHLEVKAKQAPRLYGFKVQILGLFGILIIPTTLLFFTGFALWITLLSLKVNSLTALTIKLVLLPLAIINYTVFKAMGGEKYEPEGIKVTKENCPDLFSTIEEVKQKLSAPEIHHVYIDDNFNASLSQSSRTRLFWWPETTLTLGMPLLQSLSAEETKAIIAHELGHLIKGDGASGAWTYYLRSSWNNMRNHAVDDYGLGWTFVKVFLHKFVPYFQAYSYVQSREQEIIADQASAYTVGPEITQSALNRVFIEGHTFNEHFWGDFFRKANASPEPELSPFKTINNYMSEQSDDIRSQALSETKNRTADLSDTHPSPADRLKTIGGKLETPPLVQVTAAHILLSDFEQILIEKLTTIWWQDAKSNWAERYQNWQDNLKEREDLEKEAQKGMLSEDSALKLARLIQLIDGWDAAIPTYEKILKRHPENSHACLCVGWQRLEDNDETGLQLLDNVIANTPDMREEACQDAINYFNKQDRKQEAEKYIELLEQHKKTARAAAEEREEFKDDDQIEPHQMPPWQLTNIVDVVRKVPEIKEAHLFRKKVEHLPDQPIYVLAFTGVSHMHLMQDEDPIERLQELWPENLESFIVSIDIHMPQLTKKLPRDGSSIIFKRN